MRTAASRNTRRQAVARTVSIQAPVGGLNTRDSLAAMPTGDAVILENMFPRPSDVILRRGFTNHATGLTGMVRTLSAYTSPTVSKLFAASNGNIHEVTSVGAVGAAVQSGLTNNDWQHALFGTAGGSFLYMVNGSDEARLYNGTAWIAHGITGIATTSLIHVNAHKARLWFVEKNSLRAWYLPTLSISGAATAFDLSSLFTRGGFLMAMGTWTLDSGAGPDDLALFITSKGEVAVYKGTDPGSASTWALVGIYNIGSPIGRRCFLKYQTELLLLTQNGVYPISTGLAISTQGRAAITDKIVQSVSDSIIAYGTNFGWEIEQFPRINLLLLNVPTSSTASQQYVMNTLTGSWSRFTGWNTACWEIFNDEPYFGGNGIVGHAWDGNSDAGANIVGDALQAFSYFGKRTQNKIFTMARPIISTNAGVGIVLGVNVDYDTSAPVGVPTFTSAPTSLWGTMVWGIGSWASGQKINKEWQTVNAVGYCAGLHMKMASNVSEASWVSTDYVYQEGGIV